MPRKGQRKTRDQRIAEFMARLDQETPTRAPTTDAERAARARDRLERTELAISKTDHRRIKLLLRAGSLAADQEDYGAVHGYAQEIAALCRSRVLGMRDAHPILSTLPPPPRVGSDVRALRAQTGPPIDVEIDTDESTG